MASEFARAQGERLAKLEGKVNTLIAALVTPRGERDANRRSHRGKAG